MGAGVVPTFLAAANAPSVEGLDSVEELDAWESELVPASVVGTRATLARVDGVPVEIVF